MTRVKINISLLSIRRCRCYDRGMRAHQNPLFRKVIAPWYDSELACILVIIFMVPVLCFACLGMAVALDMPAYQGYLGVPLLLILMSLYVLLSTAIRLFMRKRGSSAKFD